MNTSREFNVSLNPIAFIKRMDSGRCNLYIQHGEHGLRSLDSVHDTYEQAHECAIKEGCVDIRLINSAGRVILENCRLV